MCTACALLLRALDHVASRPNLEFVTLDLFSHEAVTAVRELARDSPTGCVVLLLGMHACGALSPRLLALASHLEEVDGCALCPCCIKGGLGHHVKQRARACGRPNYDVLLEVLAGVAVRECGERADVAISHDVDMLSPKNGFVTILKRTAPPSLHLAHPEDRTH